jgi:NUMOD3 motif
MERKFYVYVYFRADGSPCYIGKGTGNRWRIHERRSPNKHLANIVRGVGGDLPKLKIRENLTNEEAKEIEVALIRAIGREIHGGPLVNQTNGGDGHRGWSPEMSAKIRAVHLGRKQSAEEIERRAAAMRGRVRSQAERDAISRGRLGIRPDAAARAKMSAAKKGHALWLGRRHSEETKAKISAKKKGLASPNRGRPISAEQKLKISAAMKGRPWSSQRRIAQIARAP